MMKSEQPQAVAYYSLTESQLQDFASSIVTKTLEGLGITQNAEKTMLADSKDEYRPLAYWLKKMNVNRSTLWRWQHEGLITPTYMGRKLYYRQSDFDAMFAAKENK